MALQKAQDAKVPEDHPSVKAAKAFLDATKGPDPLDELRRAVAKEDADLIRAARDNARKANVPDSDKDMKNAEDVLKRLDALEALKKAIKTNDASPVRDALDKARDAKVPKTNPTVKEAEDLLKRLLTRWKR